MRSFYSALALLTLFLAPGCSSERVPVEGIVTLDGKPLPVATVTFQATVGTPEDSIFVGETDGQGKYALEPFGGGSSGAPAGRYRVTITSVKIPPDADERTILPPEKVPRKWRDGSKWFDVPEKGTAEADFEIMSRSS
jgi:hypothetical protein